MLLAHISDLHFGSEDPRLARALADDIGEVRPQLVAVSGDLTQRARRRQFEAAASFLARLPEPRLVVPGNHDIPLFDVPRRFLDPLGRFRRYVGAQTDPFYADERLAALGLCTPRPSLWKDGRLSAAQVDRIERAFTPLAPGVFKVIVTHHPFVPRGSDPRPARLVGRAAEGLRAAEKCGVELFLAGHLHQGYLADLREHHATLQRSILVAQAGTALSHRRRGEPNGYNLIHIDSAEVAFEVRAWNGERFVPQALVRYIKAESLWKRVDEPTGAGAVI